jgi:hypothetical protein
MPAILFIYDEATSGYISDPYFSQVVLGIHGTSPIVDITGKSLSIAGTITGSSSGMTVTSGGSITLGASEDFNFGTGDFTVELYANSNNVYPSITVFQYGNYVGERSFTISYVSGKARFWRGAAGTTTGNATITNDVVTGVWYHLAVVKYNSTINFYVNGVLAGSTPDSNTWNTAAGIRIGAGDTATATWAPMYFFGGSIKDVRITKGVARYTSNFAIPAVPFPNA